MHRTNFRTIFRAATVLAGLATLVLASPARADIERGSFERTLTVSGPVTVDVVTPYGEITVTTGAPGEVAIRAWIKAKSDRHNDYTPEEVVRRLTENPPIEQTGDTIRIGRITDEEEEKGFYHGTQVRYELVVPAETALRARSGYGDISVSGVNRPAEVSTGYGNVELSNPTGGVTVKTGYGDIRVEGAPTDDWQLKTGYGTVELDLPADASFELDARTGFGEVDTAHPVTVTGGFRKSRLRGTVRAGGPRVAIKTGFGDIILNIQKLH